MRVVGRRPKRRYGASQVSQNALSSAVRPLKSVSIFIIDRTKRGWNSLNDLPSLDPRAHLDDVYASAMPFTFPAPQLIRALKYTACIKPCGAERAMSKYGKSEKMHVWLIPRGLSLIRLRSRFLPYQVNGTSPRTACGRTGSEEDSLTKGFSSAPAPLRGT